MTAGRPSAACLSRLRHRQVPAQAGSITASSRAQPSGDDLHPPPAARTQEGIDLVHLANEAGPSRLSSTQAGAADLQGRPVVRAGDWLRRFGFREERALRVGSPGHTKKHTVNESGKSS